MNPKRRWARCWPPIFLAAVIVATNLGLRDRRRDLLPEAPLEAAQDIPPTLTLIQVGLGGFRGLLVDLLWLRASILKERNQFVELVQLSEWITILDPYAAEAWSYHAWNMAYNVSIMLRRPEDRWRWVRHGISLLRDRGLRYNPTEAALYYELGWLFQHKIGSHHDRAHGYYKCALAAEIAPWLTAEGRLPDPPEPATVTALREKLGLRAERMRAIEQRFGALDWRLPESHALYWAWLGLSLNDRRRDRALRRMIYHSLRDSVDAGRLVEYDLETQTWITAPNPDLIPATAAFFEESLERHPGAGMGGPYARFLARAIHLAQKTGDSALAREMYAKLTRECARRGLQPPAFETVAAGDFSHPVFAVAP